jgi:hypothetical protein
MLDLRFRVYFDSEAATVEDLAHIEEITVEQGEDAAWEARLVMALCLDAEGHWERQNDIALRPRTQVRIELKIGSDNFKPLIEGPIVGVDTVMDSRPGRSTATVVIHDDSAWFNMASRPITTEGRTDEEIARELFAELPPGATIPPLQPQIEISEPASPPSLGPQFAQLGTPMQKLRHLAQRNGCRAYVLPGETKGQSIGCIKGDPEGEPSLPALVLLGEGRNLADVAATEDPESSAQTELHTLRLGDQQVVSYTTQASDAILLGNQPAAPEPATRTASPNANDSEDARARAAAQARLRNFPIKYSGRLISGAYPKVLQPYQKVALQAGGASVSAVLLLTKVTHRLTPSMYSVEFEGRGNSLSDLQAATGLPGNIL